MVDEKGFVSLECQHPERQWICSGPRLSLLKQLALDSAGLSWWRRACIKYSGQARNSRRVRQAEALDLCKGLCILEWLESSRVESEPPACHKVESGLDMASRLESGASECSFQWDERNEGDRASQQMPARREGRRLGGLPQGPHSICTLDVNPRCGCIQCLPPPRSRDSE